MTPWPKSNSSCGNKDEAIAAQKKAVALEPKCAYFRNQLKRIEAGDPAADGRPRTMMNKRVFMVGELLRNSLGPHPQSRKREFILPTS